MNHAPLAALFLAMTLAAAEPRSSGVRAAQPAWSPPAGAIHVDPTHRADPKADGSEAHPFASLAKIRWRNGTTVVLRRGTVLETPAFRINGESLTLGAYGEGAPPVIRCTSEAKRGKNQHAIRVDSGPGLVLRDLDIHAPKGTSCLRLGGGKTTVSVLHCRIRGAAWGIRAFGFSGLQILDTEVHDIKDDGMFIVGVNDIEIGHCFVHDVNQNWKPPYTSQKQAGGDAIQFVNCDRWRVHHCVLDRTNSGNKFCFISNNPKQKEGVFEHNLTRGPLTTGDGGSAIYMHDGDGLVVRYNTVLGPAPSMLYSHAANLRIYGNVCSGTSGGIFASKSAEVYHNTFLGQQGYLVSGGKITAANNIFVLGKGTESAFGKVKALREDHNLQTQGNPGFVDAPKLDFRLRADSRCVGAGRQTPIRSDRLGTPIPTGPAPDLGAFERH
ncbi:MAG: hypothetical protein HN849_31320 [Victivallales bacterium]|nr:hypothetical protein [Victivallales bacterium]